MADATKKYGGRHPAATPLLGYYSNDHTPNTPEYFTPDRLATVSPPYRGADT